MSIPDKYDLYIFDLDGTLVNSLPCWLEIYQAVFKELGVYPSETEIIDVAFYNHDRLHELVPIEYNDFLKILLRHKSNLHTMLKSFSGAQTVLKGISQKGKNIALCTSSYRKAVDDILLHTDLRNCHFNLVVTGDSIERQKPYPDGVNEIRDVLKVSPAKTLYIGDSYTYFETARNAGVDFLWMNILSNKPYILETQYQQLLKGSKYQMTSYT